MVCVYSCPKENSICTLKGSLPSFKFIEILDLSKNQLRGLGKTVESLKKFSFLTHLNLQVSTKNMHYCSCSWLSQQHIGGSNIHFKSTVVSQKDIGGLADQWLPLLSQELGCCLLVVTAMASTGLHLGSCKVDRHWFPRS